MATSPFNVGDKAYYAYRAGWGGGATRQAYAVIIDLHRTMATIRLWDARANQCVVKRVSLSKLTPRQSHYAPLDGAGEDYDRLPFSDGSGELFLGEKRSASYSRVRPGYTEITLTAYEFKDARRAEIATLGYCEQGEKAPDVCRVWMETGAIPKNNFRRTETRRSR